jgi:drug/metabolite transporter (DMT)-like permease
MAVPRRVWIFLALGLAAASQSGNIIRLAEANAVAIAAWRLLIATALLAPLAGGKLRELARLTRTELVLLLVTGVALAAHFVAWIAAVQLTTVANAAVCFAINPVLTATAGFVFFREPVDRRLVISIVLGLTGVVALGGGDLSFAPEHLAGDGMAFLCSVLFTVYFLLGKRLRRVLSTSVHVTAIYGVAAIVCFGALLASGLPVVGYGRMDWICFGLMALVPTMIGHTSFNNALKYIPAGRISVLTLSEPLAAGVVAFLAWDEAISWNALVGYLLISSSVLVLFVKARALADQKASDSSRSPGTTGPRGSDR